MGHVAVLVQAEARGAGVLEEVLRGAARAVAYADRDLTGMDTVIYAYICVCIYIYIYTYVYVYTYI